MSKRHATERPGRGHATKRPGQVLDMGRLQLSASSLDEQERQRQQTRREALQKVWDALRLGEALAKERDDHKRSYDEMNDTEQQILEDFETGRTKKQKQRLTTPRMRPFRCKLEIKH